MSSGSIRIIQLPEKSSVNTDDYMAVDSSANGTKKVKFTDLLDNNLSAQNKAADAQATGEAINDVNARVDNMINTQTNASVTTLWTGTLESYNQQVTLSEDVSHFDYIDIYISQLDYQFIRRPVASLGNPIQIQATNLLDDGSPSVIQFWEGAVNISGTTAKITKANLVNVHGDATYTPPTAVQNVDIPRITRIDGVKIGHVDNDEVVDARVGADGTIYPTLGDAIRGQVDNLQNELNYIETTVFEFSTESATSPMDDAYQWLMTSVSIAPYTKLSKLRFKTSLSDGTTVSATFRLFEVSGNYASAYSQQTASGTALGGFIIFDVNLTTNSATSSILGIESDSGFARVFSSTESLKNFNKGATAGYIGTGLNYYAIYMDAISISTAIDEIPQLQDDIEQIQDNWQEVIKPSEIDIFSYTNDDASPATAGYSWIIRNLSIPAGTFISTLSFKTNATVASTLKINLWSTNDSVNYTKYKEVEFTPIISDGYAIINFNDIIDRESLIGIISSSNIVKVGRTSTSELLYPSDVETSFNLSTVPKTNYQLVVDIKTKTNAIRELEKEVANLSGDLSALDAEIHVGEGLQYEEIQDALDALTTDYATIIVHPKDTPYSRFSLMRRLSGSYPWTGLTTVKHISIIGIDKEKCVIQDDSGNYDTPPAEIATNGIIKNLRFIATHDDSDGTETTGSYAVHVDNRPADVNGMKLIFENCDFVSYQMSAVGLGLYRNQDILFDSCNFESHTDPTWKPNENYNSAYFCALGAYFMHTTMGNAGGNMFIRFRNCFLYHEGGSHTMRIEDGDNPQTALLEAIGNTLWDADNQNAGYYVTGYPIMQMPYNNGNNATELNA